MGDHVPQSGDCDGDGNFNGNGNGNGTTTLSSHRSNPAATPPSSASSPLKKGMHQVELELRLLEAFAIYRPSLLVGMHRHFILFGLMDHLERRLNQRFSPDEVLQLLDRFFNLELLKPDDDELELVNQEEDFSLPSSIFEEIKGRRQHEESLFPFVSSCFVSSFSLILKMEAHAIQMAEKIMYSMV